MQLPISLDDLPPETRSWMISKSAAKGVDPGRLVHDVLNRDAAKDGFKPSGPSLASSPTPAAPKKEGGL